MTSPHSARVPRGHLFLSLLRGGLAAALATAVLANAAESGWPHLRKQGTATQLIVDGEPLLLRGGELGNSTGEPDYLKPSWAKFQAMNLNAIVTPVYWDVIEPVEGKFDFATVDGLLRDAREARMRLVLLWFGSWKNSMSCYAPAWVKTDPARFPRARDRDGTAQEILTPCNATNRDTDARAFAALLRHLREADGTQHTVVLVQVENEIGMIPSARDHSKEADAAFNAAVPAMLLDALKKQRDAGTFVAPELRDLWAAAGGKTAGTWREVFGDSIATEEIFMAWQFARYTEAVAAAGKAEFALPMYVNAALIRPAYQPGQYPSAGPLPHLIDIWRAGAPSLDFLAPDIYFPNFAEWTAKYVRGGNPLFIPEALRSPDAAINALYAFGQHDAIGFCPFGIETINEPAQSYLGQSFALIKQLTPLLLAHQGQGHSAGLLPPAAGEQRQPHRLRLGDYWLNITYERSAPPPLADGVILPTDAPRGAAFPTGGLVLNTAPGEYVFAGAGVIATFEPVASGEIAGILSVEEGVYDDAGQWQHVRWLNGDQTHQGRHLRLEPGSFTIQRLKLYTYR